MNEKATVQVPNINVKSSKIRQVADPENDGAETEKFEIKELDDGNSTTSTIRNEIGKARKEPETAAETPVKN